MASRAMAKAFAHSSASMASTHPPVSAPAESTESTTALKPSYNQADDQADAPFISKCVAEFAGTFLLVFTIGCNVFNGNMVWAGVSIGCMLMVAVYALGGISGGNFNPAVSVSLGVVQSLGGKGMDWATVGIYCIVQIIGGIAAAIASYSLYVDSLDFSMLNSDNFNLTPRKGFSWLSAWSCEMLYTFMLCFVVLNVAAAKKFQAQANQWYGLAIGFVVVAGAYGAGAISGGCFNPAVAIGIDVASARSGFGWCFVYSFAELIGAVLAACLFKVVRPEDFNADEQSEMKKKLVSEFLGTFFLVLTVGLNVLGKSPAGAFSIAAALMCMIYALGDVSGAHFNPAVTLTFLFEGDFDVSTTASYMVVQVFGAVVAAFTYTLMYRGENFALAPQNNSKWGEVAAAEIIFTFILCYVVLCTVVSKETKSSAMYGIAIGSCVTVGGFAIGHISGGSLNPAVSCGIAISHLPHGGSFLPAIWFSCFEFAGALVTVGLYKITHKSALKKDVEMDD